MGVGRAALVAGSLGVILGAPFVLRSGRTAGATGDGPMVIVVTPHVAQIRDEISLAFDRWHWREHGGPARIEWRQPGGTPEIRAVLFAQYEAAAARALDRAREEAGSLEGIDSAGLARRIEPRSMAFDVMLGGGTFEHERLKRGIRVQVPVAGERREVALSLSVAAGFGRERLVEWYGEPNLCGTQPIYDADEHWLGTALSSFGIVFNRDVLSRLGVPEPRRFADLADPRLVGRIAMADPRQSGSIATALDSVLGHAGWEEGWRVLRGMTGNARYYTASASRVPIDVAMGDAAAGLAIDFYGRSQAQVVMSPGETVETSRVGFVEPRGATYVDADPVSILREGPNPAMARRFVEFCLSEEGQALWPMAPVGEREDGPGAHNPRGIDGRPLGPVRHALRRLPVRRVMYERYGDAMVDGVNPFEVAGGTRNPGWRDGVQLMVACFAIDLAAEQQGAWRALARARSDQAFSAERLAEMERLYYAWPEHEMPPDASGAVRRLAFTEVNFAAIAATWRDAEWRRRSRVAYTRFFRECYRRVEEMGRGD